MTMKKYITIPLMFLVHSALFAQSNYDVQVQNQRMIMNDGLYDMITKYKMNWDINVPVKPIEGGITVELEAPRTSSGSERNFGKKKYTISPSEVNARINADREWRMEQARRKQEAERLRKKMEDDQSEMRARMQHALATAQFYANAAARDHWHATEGAKMLAEIKASDFVNLPQRQETPGAELAAGIKPKGSITVVSAKVLKSDKSFDAQNDVVDVVGNGIMDERQVDGWEKSFELSDLISLNTKPAESKREPQILVKSNELPLDSLCMFTLPWYGLVAVWGDSLMVLKDKNFGTIAWMDKEQYSDVVPCGNKLIGKKDSTLYIIDEEQSEKLLQLNTEVFTIFPNDDKSIYLLSWEGGMSTILYVNIESRSYTEKIRLPYNIWTVVSNGRELFAVVENAVFVIAENGIPVKLFTSDLGINDIALTEAGLLIATYEQILYVRSKDDMGVYYDQGVQRLWADGQGVYALDGSNELLYFKN